MGNCMPILSNTKTIKSLPIDTIFKLPSPLPSWNQGDGFGSEYLDLGGLKVHQTSNLSKNWVTYKGGPENLGATFFEPTQIPDGFFMLGSYCQPNNRPFFGWVLVGKDLTGETLVKPNDYSLVWSSSDSSSSSSKIKNQDSSGSGYIWLPVPPDGYKSVGYVVTNTPDKPSTDRIRCVVSSLTDELEGSDWIWGEGKNDDDDEDGNAFGVFDTMPKSRNQQAQGVAVGSFVVRSKDNGDGISCLKNNNFSDFKIMPNLKQIEALFEVYSPLIYFHSEEIYMPSSVNWYFQNGALLYSNKEESNPVPIEINGSNLPQGESNDGTYWIDLPIDDKEKERVKKGDLASTEVYLHVKPMLGGSFTDISVWIFYPFNGPGTAKIGLIDIPLGRIGEHIGDWEHFTLRISNFNGVLNKIYLSQHSKGSWVNASMVEFKKGTNKAVIFAAKYGHPFYYKPGLVLQGGSEFGIRNDTDKSEKFLDTGSRFSIVSAEYLGSEVVVEPPWLNYRRKWGPKIAYKAGVEAEHLEGKLQEKNKSSFKKVIKTLPNEFYGEDGPTGPKEKGFWNGDEKS